MVDLYRNNLRNKALHTGRFLFCLTLLIIMAHVLTNKTTDSNIVAYASAANLASAAGIDTDNKRVYDDAGLLNSYEIEELETLSHESGEKAGIEIFILTHNDKNATYPEKYIEDFEDQLPVGDRVYFLYDVYNGEIFMEGYGLAETYIHSKRIDKIFDNVEDYLRNGYYYDAFKTYITMSADYMEDDSELNYDHDYSYDKTPEGFDPNNEYSYDEYDYEGHYRKDELQNSILLDFWFQLFVALVIGGIVVGALAYRSSGRMTAGARDYLDRSRGGLIGRRDQYIRSTVTRWRKPQQNTSSGGSRGGFNAGGFRGGTSSG
ncbi:MAG: hypothetical protein EWM47_13095, partial [Anaerolineaceae bacterium]